jgi:5-methylcytosine-specific restriction endonuclease McrA
MPIRPENKDLYPANWPEIRADILKRAGDKCERCGLPNHSWGYREDDGSFVNLGDKITPTELMLHGQLRPGKKAFRVRLTIMHLDHNPANCDPSNLSAACEQCHNRYDAPVRATNRKKRLRREYAVHQQPLDLAATK